MRNHIQNWNASVYPIFRKRWISCECMELFKNKYLTAIFICRFRIAVPYGIKVVWMLVAARRSNNQLFRQVSPSRISIASSRKKKEKKKLYTNVEIKTTRPILIWSVKIHRFWCRSNSSLLFFFFFFPFKWFEEKKNPRYFIGLIDNWRWASETIECQKGFEESPKKKNVASAFSFTERILENCKLVFVLFRPAFLFIFATNKNTQKNQTKQSKTKQINWKKRKEENIMKIIMERGLSVAAGVTQINN